MYFLLKMGIFQPVMLVKWREIFEVFIHSCLLNKECIGLGGFIPNLISMLGYRITKHVRVPKMEESSPV